MAEKAGEKKGKNVFISWSGDRSEKVAEALHKWIPQFIQSVKPWMSKPDMTKGVRWGLELGERLEQTSVGIICLTPDNLGAPWIVFEAGAISKEMRDSRACTYLFDLDHTDVEGPLAQFHHTKAEKEDTKKLLYTINEALGAPEGSLLVAKEILNVAFETFWPELEKALKNVPPQPKVKPPKRKQEDKIDDILAVVRRLEKEGSRRYHPATADLIPNIYPDVWNWVNWLRSRHPDQSEKDQLAALRAEILRGQQTQGVTVTEPLKPEGDDKDKEDKDE